MSKTLQTIVIRSKYGKIANVFTAVRSMKDLVDETFPKYIEQMQEFASDGKRTVTFRDGSTQLGGVRDLITTSFKDDPEAIGYSNQGRRMERSIMLQNDGDIYFTRKFNDQECFEACEKYAPLDKLIEILTDHPNFEIVEYQTKAL